MSGIISKIKSLFGSSSPIDAEMTETIQKLVMDNLVGFKEKYIDAFSNITKTKVEEDEPVVFSEVDKEAKIEAGLETIMEEIGNLVKTEVMPIIEKELPEQELARKAGVKAAEKGIDKIVEKSINEIVAKLSSEQQET